jgi:site-specific DNA recombinase
MIEKIIDIMLTFIRAAIYSRYSIEIQNDKSIDDQNSECKKYASKNNMSVRDENIYSDYAISGSIKDRPSLMRLLEDAKNHCFDVILVDDLSRLTRDAQQCFEIVEKVRFYGIAVISVSENINTNDEGSRLLYQIKAILNEQFLVGLKAKTIRGQIGQLERGYNVGSLPPGYIANPDGVVIIKKGREPYQAKKPIIDETAAKIVIQVYKDFADGKSICEIIKELNEAHIPTKRNLLGAWAPATIHLMLRNERYIGKWDWGKRQTKRNPETGKPYAAFRDEPLLSQTFEDRRIISDELWEKVQKRLTEIRPVWPGGKRKKGFETQKGSRVMAFPKHLLEGAMTCSMCGSTMGLVSGTHGGYYGCMDAKKGKCDNKLIVRKEIVEQKILSTIVDLLDNTECIHNIFKKAESVLNELVNTVPNDISCVTSNLREITRQITNLVKFIAGTDDPAAAEICSVRQTLRELQVQKSTLEKNLQALESQTSTPYKAPSLDWVREKVHNIKATLELKAGKSALLLRDLLGPISLKPVFPEMGKPYLQADSKLQVWTLVEKKRAPNEGPSQVVPLGSTSFVWRPRADSNGRPLP